MICSFVFEVGEIEILLYYIFKIFAAMTFLCVLCGTFCFFWKLCVLKQTPTVYHLKPLTERDAC